MKTIIEYIKEKISPSFNECILTPVDMLIFAELSYCELKKFGSIYKAGEFTNFNLLNDDDIIDKITKHTIERDYNVILLKELFKSPHYQQLQMAFYTDRKSSKDVMQYASMVFKIGNNYIVVFRGTDMSLLGWQEDLNLSFLDRLPSHELCVNFFQEVVEQLPEDANIYICGHSKGGNFATFAGTFALPKYQERIKGIYDFDGPGYRSNIFSSHRFKSIETKYNKIVPYDSLVGTLMVDYSKYKVVSAVGANGILQHSPFRWELDERGDFVYLPKISKSSRAFDLAFDAWLSKRNDQTKMAYTKAIFTFLDKCGIKDLRQLSSTILPLFKRAIAQQKSLTREDKKEAFDAIFDLGKLFLYYRFKRST
ncbi:MAG: DUF2974 domain-containing protein [Bacilli bacterium]|nr:DUF2974 domain-containing protein [Bacilli bacterium]